VEAYRKAERKGEKMANKAEAAKMGSDGIIARRCGETLQLARTAGQAVSMI
jgi:hypothetical protein